MTDAEKIQLLGRTMLAANEYIRQLEEALGEYISTDDLNTRGTVAQARWRLILPEAQQVFA